MAYIVMAYIIMAYIVMVYIIMAYSVMGLRSTASSTAQSSTPVPPNAQRGVGGICDGLWAGRADRCVHALVDRWFGRLVAGWVGACVV